MDENEENVIKEAVGGYANISAYCLIYIADDCLQEEQKIKQAIPEEIQSSNVIDIERHHYSTLIPHALVDEIEADNIIFHEEIEEYKFNSYSKSIIDSYKSRLDKITKATENKDPKAVPGYLNSFACFLKNQKGLEDLLKWYIVDTSLFDSQKKVKLRELKSTPKLLKLLEDRLSSLPKPHGFKHLTLTSLEEEKLNSNFKSFQQEHLVIVYSRSFILACLEEKWRDACYAVRMVLDVSSFHNLSKSNVAKVEKDPKSYFIKLVSNVTRIVSLKLALSFEQLIKNNEFDKVISRSKTL